MFLLHHQIAFKRNAHAQHGRIDNHVRAIEIKPLHGNVICDSLVGKPGFPLDLRLYGVDEPVLQKVGSVQGLFPCERGRADRQEPLLDKFLDVQAWPSSGAVANFHVHQITIEIGRFVGPVEPQVYIRIGLEKAGQAGQYPFGGNGGGRPDCQKRRGLVAADDLRRTDDFLDMLRNEVEIIIDCPQTLR